MLATTYAESFLLGSTQLGSFKYTPLAISESGPAPIAPAGAATNRGGS
jgi:hypothetical protein